MRGSGFLHSLSREIAPSLGRLISKVIVFDSFLTYSFFDFFFILEH